MGMTIDYGQLVMDNEFARMIKYSLQGIPVNDETLAVDVMHDVGPAKDFLGHDHTFKHMEEQSQPALIDRRMREDWQASGSTEQSRAQREVLPVACIDLHAILLPNRPSGRNRRIRTNNR